MKTITPFSWTLLAVVGIALAAMTIQQPLHSASGKSIAPVAPSASSPAVQASGEAKQVKANPEVITVVVHPLNAPVTSMVTQQFKATVGGTKNTAVNWYVDGVEGGNDQVGTISTTGLYAPPSNFTVGTHTVEAVSQQNPKKNGTATVYLVGLAGVYTNKYDNFRDGQNLQETVLTPANVNVNTFGKLFSYPVDGVVTAQPLYVANVYLDNPQNGSPGYYNVVYVVTEHDSVYAYDASGTVSGPLWQDSFIDPPTVIPVPGSCIGYPGTKEWGITSTPVIDPNTNTIYVEARTLENATGCNGTYVHRLHALDITSGEEKFGGPVVIQAQVPGTGKGSQNGILSFSPQWENNRPGLLESQSVNDPNPVVYVGSASLNDYGPYHGWVLGLDSQTLALDYVFCTTPDGEAGGIWQMGSGLAADSNGNLFLATGNGTFDNISDFAQSVLELTPEGNGNLVMSDYYTPDTYKVTNSQDWDVSSGGILILPDQPGSYPHLAIGGGKEGTIYVMDRDNLGGYDPTGNNIVQYIVGAIKGSIPDHSPFYGIWNASSYFNENVYIFGEWDYPKMFTMSNGLLPTTATSTGTIIMGGPVANISANGTDDAIVWLLQTDAAVMRAYDPSDLTQEYYDTNQKPGRDGIGGTRTPRVSLLVANGRVYVLSDSKVIAYGLLQ